MAASFLGGCRKKVSHPQSAVTGCGVARGTPHARPDEQPRVASEVGCDLVLRSALRARAEFCAARTARPSRALSLPCSRGLVAQASAHHFENQVRHRLAAFAGGNLKRGQLRVGEVNINWRGRVLGVT